MMRFVELISIKEHILHNLATKKIPVITVIVVSMISIVWNCQSRHEPYIKDHLLPGAKNITSITVIVESMDELVKAMRVHQYF